VPVRTNQRDSQMTYDVDDSGADPSINYEPSLRAGLAEAPKPAHDEQGPEINGRLTRSAIARTQDYKQAGQRYIMSEQWEKDDLVENLTGLLGQCDRAIQERMVWHLFLVENELGQRIGDGLGISADDVRHLQPLPAHPLSGDDLQRLANLGNNPAREVGDLVMTHCVPNEHVPVADEAVTA
jgi:catalase